MARKLRIAVIHNEPTVQTPEGRKYFYEVDVEQRRKLYTGSSDHMVVDLSEVGVIEEREDVCTALEESGFETLNLNLDEDVPRLIHFLASERPDLIFNLCESIGEESIHEMHVCSVYELLRIPYTGAPPLALGLCLSKARTKQILAFHGIPTPRFVQFIDPPARKNGLALKFPLIVKPGNEDASVGIENESVVHDFQSLQSRVEFVIREFQQPAIVEEFIEGREVNAAILGNSPPEVLPLSEIVFSTMPDGFQHIVSYNAKWMRDTIEYQNTRPLCPAPLPPSLEAKIRAIALTAYHALGCRDYARIDMRLDREMHPFVIEVNPNPDLSDDAGFARSGKTAGMDYHAIIRRIVEVALARVRCLHT